VQHDRALNAAANLPADAPQQRAHTLVVTCKPGVDMFRGVGVTQGLLGQVESTNHCTGWLAAKEGSMQLVLPLTL
jgi:hypothetical protein